MGGTTELLALRLALIGVVFAFALAAALVLRASLRPTLARRAPGSARTARGGARLVLVAPAQCGLPTGAEFALAGEMTVGRDVESGILLADPSVSGQHAAIARVAQGWRLTDLGSTNGTFVNGRRIDGRGALLRGGDQVTVGAVSLRFQS
ncbi:MAG: FHA domain-containing protein [Gemmataceae bacterium]|nr:FHA domain-containing protein [Gemmataceae bacterium]